MNTKLSLQMSRFEIDRGLAIVTFDEPGLPVNKFGSRARDDIQQVLDLVEQDAKTVGSIRGLVFRSAKATCFAAGADIDEMKGFDSYESAFRLSWEGQVLLSRIEKLEIPTFALINGWCIGGGLELASVCKFRFASDHEKTAFMMPEMRIGIIPGLGGTQRLPKLMGTLPALNFILTGRKMGYSEAQKRGLVDLVLDASTFTDASLETARRYVDGDRATVGLIEVAKRERRRLKVKGGAKLILSALKPALLVKTQGQIMGPAYLADCLRMAKGELSEAKLRRESHYFALLASNPTSQALMKIFLMNEKMKKHASTSVFAGEAKLSDEDKAGLKELLEFVPPLIARKLSALKPLGTHLAEARPSA